MPVINRGDDYFAVVTYTGNGTSQTISGLRFQPDFVWIKGRSGATDHALYDAQRGVQKRLESNTTDAEVSSDNGVTAFNSDGFSIGSLAQVNTNGATYVAWCWKEGATQGFDIAAFTAPASGNFTVAHSLGVAPAMFILKSRSYADGWYVYHKNLATPASNYLTMNATSAVATSTSIWGNTAPTSSVVTLGAGAGIAGSATGILYLFAEVAGFSAFGSYTGNGSADGPFVFCGFRPRWLMTKRTDSATSGDWNIVDTARGTYNVVGPYVYANQSAAEGSAAIYDILSNGFKIRETGAGTNANGSTYIYAAFSEVGFKYALGR